MTVMPAGLPVVIPAGSLLVTNGASTPATITALNPITGAVLATLGLAPGTVVNPVAGVFHPGVGAGGTIFLLDAGTNTIVAIDPTTLAVVGAFPSRLPIGNGGLAVGPTVGNLWVSSSLSRSIAEITPAGTLVRTVSLSSMGLLTEASGLAFLSPSEVVISTNIGDVKEFALPSPA